METEILTKFEVLKGEKVTRDIAFEEAEKEMDIRGFTGVSLIKENDTAYTFEFRNRIAVDLDDEN